MDFSWSPSERALYDEALTFARERVNPEIRRRNGKGAFTREEWRLCAEAGLLGLSAPADRGGRGLGALSTALAVEGFARGCEDAGLVFSASAHLFACVMPIAEHADDALQGRVLPKLCSGEWVGANAITEPEAGSDVFALGARAVRDGDDYVVTGNKSYVTNAPVADCFLVYASTEPSHGYLGITAFVVEASTPGLTLGEPFEKIGLNGAPVCGIELDACRVPAANRVGAEGRGASIFNASMSWERACLFAQYVGSMDRQLEEVVAHVRRRKQFGKALARNQAVSHRVADMKLRLEAARLLLYRACWMKDQGLESTLEVSLAKLAVSEGAVQSGLDAIQLFGGAGIRTDAGVERALRDAVPSTIFSGTSEIQRDLVARGVGL